MKRFIRNLTKIQIILTILGTVSFLIFLGLQAAGNMIPNSLEDQQEAKRWSGEGGTAQVSCFFSQGAGITGEQLTSFEKQLDSVLKEDSIEPPNKNARLWSSTYSGTGKVTVVSDKGKLTANAIGVSGDFFMFHPLKLISGGFFSGSDIMNDYVVIDEDAAWQLFGSNDVAGMQVEIGGVPHTIVGVVERASGKINKAAGLDATTVYVSYNTLENYGTSYGINCYEIVMPNPISGFALSTVKSKLTVDEKDIMLVENTKRFSLFSLFSVIRDFGVRSMSKQEIIFPYWENVARYYEDQLAVILALKLIFLLFPVILIIILAVRAFRHRKWHWRDLLQVLSFLWMKLWQLIKKAFTNLKKSEYDESDEIETQKKHKRGKKS